MPAIAKKEFVVYGPFEVPVGKTGKVASGRRLREFWDSAESSSGVSLRSARGVYVFAMRAGQGYTPIYVGMAGDTPFSPEAFTRHKREHYDAALKKYEKGTPVLLLVRHPDSKGRVNVRVIDEIEGALIAMGWKKNPDISNVRRRPRNSWCIRGVLLASQGHPSSAAKALRTTLGL